VKVVVFHFYVIEERDQLVIILQQYIVWYSCSWYSLNFWKSTDWGFIQLWSFTWFFHSVHALTREIAKKCILSLVFSQWCLWPFKLPACSFLVFSLLVSGCQPRPSYSIGETKCYWQCWNLNSASFSVKDQCPLRCFSTRNFNIELWRHLEVSQENLCYESCKADVLMHSSRVYLWFIWYCPAK
jgi:hypothetical protein